MRRVVNGLLLAAICLVAQFIELHSINVEVNDFYGSGRTPGSTALHMNGVIPGGFGFGYRDLNGAVILVFTGVAVAVLLSPTFDVLFHVASVVRRVVFIFQPFGDLYECHRHSPFGRGHAGPRRLRC